ncbi:MAG: CDP-diacylglycerol--glycerol-3-phosphate 3-phosphatidyltransferase [Oscillospiraceae bacterium]|nr:CDP-diacylglycerol--glycerol-3-phosphate 3-phosphatidyltransferase [Oscillospiraceae bacterium]
MTTASKITLVRVALIPLYMITMYLSGGVSGLWMWVSLGIFIVASLTDFIDGHIARKYHQVSDFGKFLDPLADKLLTIACMCMLCEWGMMPAWALMVVLTREFAVTGLRLVAVQNGTVIAAGWSGKVKTASTMVGLCFVMAFPAVSWLVSVVNVMIVVTTLYSGVEYFVQNWKCLGLSK